MSGSRSTLQPRLHCCRGSKGAYKNDARFPLLPCHHRFTTTTTSTDSIQGISDDIAEWEASFGLLLEERWAITLPKRSTKPPNLARTDGDMLAGAATGGGRKSYL
ncbi:hypothetical protein BT69DRAFT_1286186 [Atractiella rhizophila]|nr:hypothetical protein BT69DRAFT_1286186 [Atractiella rhizophila]